MRPEPTLKKHMELTAGEIRQGDMLTIGDKSLPIQGLVALPGGAKALHLALGFVLTVPPRVTLTVTRRVPNPHYSTSPRN